MGHNMKTSLNMPLHSVSLLLHPAFWIEASLQTHSSEWRPQVQEVGRKERKQKNGQEPRRQKRKERRQKCGDKENMVVRLYWLLLVVRCHEWIQGRAGMWGLLSVWVKGFSSYFTLSGCVCACGVGVVCVWNSSSGQLLLSGLSTGLG